MSITINNLADYKTFAKVYRVLRNANVVMFGGSAELKLNSENGFSETNVHIILKCLMTGELLISEMNYDILKFISYCFVFNKNMFDEDRFLTPEESKFIRINGLLKTDTYCGPGPFPTKDKILFDKLTTKTTFLSTQYNQYSPVGLLINKRFYLHYHNIRISYTLEMKFNKLRPIIPAYNIKVLAPVQYGYVDYSDKYPYIDPFKNREYLNQVFVRYNIAVKNMKTIDVIKLAKQKLVENNCMIVLKKTPI